MHGEDDDAKYRPEAESMKWGEGRETGRYAESYSPKELKPGSAVHAVFRIGISLQHWSRAAA